MHYASKLLIFISHENLATFFVDLLIILNDVCMQQINMVYLIFFHMKIRFSFSAANIEACLAT
jgi:hypothetical protein